METFDKIKTQVEAAIENNQGIRKFYETLKSMSTDFIGNDGGMTCECHTNAADLNLKLMVVWYINWVMYEDFKSLTQYKTVSWELFFCSTCYGYHEDSPFHVELTHA